MDPFMPSNLVGTTHAESFTVQPRDSAKAHGSGLVDVLSTPALVAYMEQAALHTLEPHLPDTHTSVGTRIVLDHTGAARMGECFSCEVEIDRIEGRKVVFSIRASTDEKELGLAEHTRVIVDRARFMARVLE